MKQYPLIEDCGLEVETYYAGGKDVIYYVKAAPLQKLLSEGVKVNGGITSYNSDKPKDNWGFDSHYKDDTSTHTGLVINIKPIQKEVPITITKSLFIETLKEIGIDHPNTIADALRKAGFERIESQGVE